MAVRVVHGANEGHFDLRGTTIGVVRRRLRDVFNLPSEAVALIGGKQEVDDRIINDDESVEFVCEKGIKGLGALLTPEELQEKSNITGDKYEELLILGLPLLRFQDGTIRHPEVAVDEFFRQHSIQRPNLEDQARIAARSELNKEEALVTHIQRIADHFDPPPPDVVGTGYVARKLNCTTIWITEMIRLGQIPRNCVLPGTGNGKPWKFYRTRIDHWISSR